MSDFDDQIRQIAQRHSLSTASAQNLVSGLLNTGGSQVQFNVPEWGGMGQWMPGMVMAGSLFDYGLKARVDSACTEISNLVRSGALQPPVMAMAGGAPGVSLRWNGGGNWWPGDLGTPASSGAQNNMRYAWFPGSRRLAVDLGGSVWVYDTQNHNIGGVSQQQSGHGLTLTFSSQYGIVDLASLPVVSRN